MGRIRTGSTIVLAVGVLCVSTACGGSSDDSSSGGGGGGGSSEPLKIGVINPFSGATASGGVAVTEGYEVAVDEINAKGGVMGRQVELVRGDAGTPDAGISEVNRLATSENVDMFMGTYLSAISNTASQTAARSNLLYWETNSLASDLTDRGLANFIRVGADSGSFAKVSVDSLQSVVLPALGADVKGTRVCLTHEQSIYGTSVADTQKGLLEKAGAVVTDEVAYDPAAADLGNVIVRCQQANSQVWISTGYSSDSNLLLRTAAQQGFKPEATMLVGSGDTSETLKAVPADALNAVYVTAFAHGDAAEAYAPGMQDFLAAYKKKYNKDVTFPQTTVAYAGAMVLFEALEKAGSTDPAAVQKAAASLDEPLGSTATGFGVQFDDKFQNTLALPTLVQWQSGALVTVYPEDAAPEGAKPITP